MSWYLHEDVNERAAMTTNQHQKEKENQAFNDEPKKKLPKTQKDNDQDIAAG